MSGRSEPRTDAAALLAAWSAADRESDRAYDESEAAELRANEAGAVVSALDDRIADWVVNEIAEGRTIELTPEFLVWRDRWGWLGAETLLHASVRRGWGSWVEVENGETFVESNSAMIDAVFAAVHPETTR